MELKTNTKMRIGFIGAGKVGSAFGIYLKKRGFQLSGYLSRSRQSAETAGKATDSRVYTEYTSLVKNSDLVFITSNDDQIESVAQGISTSYHCFKNRSFAHMSGALTSASLNCLKALGGDVYSVHPMQSFADVSESVEDLADTTFGIEGPQALETVISILKQCGNEYLLLTPEQKTEYHITSCIVSNFLTALLNHGFDLMQSIGVTQSAAISALTPMIEGTVRNIIKMGPEKALTGPIARGDVETVNKHLQSFDEARNNEAEIYKLLGRLTLALAQKGHLKDMKKIKALAEILS